MPRRRPRMLAVVGRFTWIHIDYLLALGAHFDVHVAWSGEAGSSVAEDALRDGVRGGGIGTISEDGVDSVRSRLEEAVAECDPDVVLVLYYHHEGLTVLAREIVGDSARLVFQCADSLTALVNAPPGSEEWTLEHEALLASDAQVFVTRALRSHLERAHGLDLGETSLIVPHGFARHTIAPPSPKLSARDGRVHVALVGTAHDTPGHHRWYVEIIRRLVSLGLVVHSHFWDLPEFGLSLEPYLELERELEDYHHFRGILRYRGADTSLSRVLSGYDLMGVLYNRGPRFREEVVNLGIHLPGKAVSGWLHGVPALCFHYQQGVVEWIEELDIGFVIDDWEDLRGIVSDPRAIAAATERCLTCRNRFTNEHNAARIRDFVDRFLERDAPRAA